LFEVLVEVFSVARHIMFGFARAFPPARRPHDLRQSGLLVLAGLLTALGILMVMVKLSRLVRDSGPFGAIAIGFLHEVTRHWWEGVPVYAIHRGGVVQPPAAWILLGPLFAWTSLDVARWIWAAAALAGLGALGAAAATAVWNRGQLARVCAWLAPFSMPALGDALGIGSLITVLLPLAVWAVLLAVRRAPTWSRDLAIAGMFVMALTDPSLTLMFFWPLLFAVGRFRPAILAIGGYAILTIAAAYGHPSDFRADIRLWFEHVQRQAGTGYGNLQDWLLLLGLERAFLPASAVLLASTAVFSWWCQRRDIWLLLGIAAIVSRLWMAPRIDHDALLIIPLMALARLASSQVASKNIVACARAALGMLGVVLSVPLNFHFSGSTFGPFVVEPSWVRLFDAVHVAAAIVALGVLVASTLGSRRASMA
jgi:hypothetical protein